ncbi:MAG: hypothetical protein M3O71_02035 [Bacteroidota bacterium]|nr:hypothetical protein [Bacteroidota bacterium]
MKGKEDEFAETREFAATPPANKIKVPYGYRGSILASVYELRKMRAA